MEVISVYAKFKPSTKSIQYSVAFCHWMGIPLPSDRSSLPPDGYSLPPDGYMLLLDGCRQSWTGGVVGSELGFQLGGSQFESPTSLIQTLLLFFSFHKYTTSPLLLKMLKAFTKVQHHCYRQLFHS